MTIRYEIQWVTESGGHCVKFGDTPEEDKERDTLLYKLQHNSAVCLLQVQRLTIEVL